MRITKNDFLLALEHLAPRELEVLGRIAYDGLENNEVAAELKIAVSTVETHRARGLRSISQYLRIEGGIGLRLFTSLWWKHVGK